MKKLRLVAMVVLVLNLTACSEKDIQVKGTQIKPVKEIDNTKIEEQVLNVSGINLKDDFKSFDEAHYKNNSLNIFNYDTYVYMELPNNDYQLAYEDYLSYLGGYYPEHASCTIKNKDYIIWDGKGYKFGVQLNEGNDLYLFKWIDNKTKNACLNSLEEFYAKGEEKLDKIDEIQDMLDEQYPEVEEELRLIYYTDKGYIKSIEGAEVRELTLEELNIIKEIIKESSLDVGDSKYDLESEYYVLTLTSNDGLVTYELVADNKSKEFYSQDGRIIDAEDDRRQDNELSRYLFSLIENKN